MGPTPHSFLRPRRYTDSLTMMGDFNFAFLPAIALRNIISNDLEKLQNEKGRMLQWELKQMKGNLDSVQSSLEEIQRPNKHYIEKLQANRQLLQRHLEELKAKFVECQNERVRLEMANLNLCAKINQLMLDVEEPHRTKEELLKDVVELKELPKYMEKMKNDITEHQKGIEKLTKELEHLCVTL